MSDGANDVVVSMASVWEMSIKVGTGRMDLPAPIERFVSDRLRHHGFDLLAIDLGHAFRAGELPRIHGDPFDRMLVAQAQIEDLALVTADPAIGQYDVEIIW
jgi:PIN domain nuclease of toxin-antitoxin system